MEANDLSERQKLILKSIIDAHISDGEPVGSKALIDNQVLDCSAATVRNDMALLEKKGYLEHLHTSSGRVPTELGYRFYVDSLIEHYAMTTHEITQINALLRSKMGELDKILSTASNLASAMTNYTGIAIRPSGATTISKFETVFLEPNHFILIMVDSRAEVRTKHIHTLMTINNGILGVLSEVLNQKIVGLSMNQISLPIMMECQTLLGEYAPLFDDCVKQIYSVLEELNNGEVTYTGLEHLLDYPEYKDTTEFQSLIGTLERKNEILDLVSNRQSNDINVVIGSESKVQVMNNSTLVYKPIVKDGKTLGAIGVIGPRRMDYAKVLATLEGLGGNITDLIHEDEEKGTEKTNE